MDKEVPTLLTIHNFRWNLGFKLTWLKVFYKYGPFKTITFEKLPLSITYFQRRQIINNTDEIGYRPNIFYRTSLKSGDTSQDSVLGVIPLSQT